MESRMDKYNATDAPVSSRLVKNQGLYDDVRKSSMDHYDIKSNVAVLDEKADKINVENVKRILDDRYNDNVPKRVSISLPKEKEEEHIEELIESTKEYDINAILEKAKKGKNVDYNRERLKKVRETQFEILNNLDLEIKNLEEEERKNEKAKEEKNLMNLINTITDLEQAYKTSKVNKDTKQALDLLSDLADDEDIEETKKESIPLPDEIKTEQYMTDVNEEEKEEKKQEEKIDETLSKLQINNEKYDDFKDISSPETSSIVIKILLILVIIALVFGAIYILDNILSLGIFS